MNHIGQKVAIGSVGRLGGEVRLLHRGLCPLTLFNLMFQLCGLMLHRSPKPTVLNHNSHLIGQGEQTLNVSRGVGCSRQTVEEKDAQHLSSNQEGKCEGRSNPFLYEICLIAELGLLGQVAHEPRSEEHTSELQ